jgi:hypothetical protein
MEMEVPALVGEHAGFANDDIGHIVKYDNPKAAEYAKRHLEQVREPIEDALKILFVHGEDVAKAAEDLKRWIDGQVGRLTP